ncbi:hypothetical protein Hanom_Chr07g00638941 [Helianthus anomalus]
MASKTGESSSSATVSAEALYCKRVLVSYNNLIQDYGIRPEWNPVLSSKTDTAFSLKKGKITQFSDFFKFCNFQLPITKFCKLVLDYYPIHISQLHPLGLVKLRQFEFACIALGHIPELVDTDVSCLSDIPTSSKDKDWKKKFFYIDTGVIPGEMHWREMGPKDKVKDDGPPEDVYVANALYKRLCGRPFVCVVIPDGALVMAWMSLLWRDIKLYPSFQRDDEGTYFVGLAYVLLTVSGITCVHVTGEWSLFDFFDPLRHTALKAADRVLGDQKPDVLKIHLEQFLLPAVPADPTAYITILPLVDEVTLLS